jgi:hypothetical protein
MTRDEIIERLNWYPPNVSGTDTLIVKIESIVRSAEAAEREACAKAAESEPAGMMNCDANGSPSDEYVAKWKVAAAIRARGEK